MADCHNLFAQFHEKIRLTNSKRDNLIKARDGIRERIRKHFIDELKARIPDFKMQGSFAMKTTTNPLSGEFDVDDGVYLKNLSDSKDDWPAPSTVHSWIYKAVDGHTKEKPKDKRTCVRVIYAGNYHVDLPIYAQINSEMYLAEKGDKGWHQSDPIKLKEWFIDRVTNSDERLRRIVRYIKAWADYESSKIIMPSSVTLTVLAADAYQNYYERDDSCLSYVLSSINNRIANSFTVPNPVDTSEDLAKRLSESQKNKFKERISAFAQDAIEALQEESKKIACKKWATYFGDRFPSCDSLDDLDTEGALITSSPAILKDDARSAYVKII